MRFPAGLLVVNARAMEEPVASFVVPAAWTKAIGPAAGVVTVRVVAPETSPRQR